MADVSSGGKAAQAELVSAISDIASRPKILIPPVLMMRLLFMRPFVSFTRTRALSSAANPLAAILQQHSCFA